VSEEGGLSDNNVFDEEETSPMVVDLADYYRSRNKTEIKVPMGRDIKFIWSSGFHDDDRTWIDGGNVRFYKGSVYDYEYQINDKSYKLIDKFQDINIINDESNSFTRSFVNHEALFMSIFDDNRYGINIIPDPNLAGLTTHPRTTHPRTTQPFTTQPGTTQEPTTTFPQIIDGEDVEEDGVDVGDVFDEEGLLGNNTFPEPSTTKKAIDTHTETSGGIYDKSYRGGVHIDTSGAEGVLNIFAPDLSRKPREPEEYIGLGY
jgi:hypothetical protein